MTPAKLNTHPAEARRSAEAQIRALIATCAPTHHQLIGALRRSLRAQRGCTVFHPGKELPDPDKLLKGSAKQVRFIGIESAATLPRPAVVRLVDEAIARHGEPFAPAGRGMVVIRPVSGRPRGRARPA